MWRTILWSCFYLSNFMWNFMAELWLPDFHCKCLYPLSQSLLCFTLCFVAMRPRLLACLSMSIPLKFHLVFFIVIQILLFFFQVLFLITFSCWPPCVFRMVVLLVHHCCFDSLSVLLKHHCCWNMLSVFTTDIF